MFHFGFSYIGLIWLLMLTIPNLLWIKNKPKGYEEVAKKENKVLLLFEKIGQALVTVSVLIFSDFNIDLHSRSASSLVILGVSFILMVCYELYWIRYFKSEKTMNDFYSSFLGGAGSRCDISDSCVFCAGTLRFKRFHVACGNDSGNWSYGDSSSA